MAHRYFETEDHTKLYQNYRVTPPPELQQYVVSYLREKYEGPLNLAVDVGCGTGQNTWGYSQYFGKVLGIDVSPSQIAVALDQKSLKPDCQNVEFRLSPAEKLDFLMDDSVQLVTVNSAAHWFNLPTFLAQVVRILVPNGVLALTGGGTNRGNLLSWEKNPARNDELTEVYARRDQLLSYSHKNHQISRNRFRDVNFPRELVDLQRYVKDKGQGEEKKVMSNMRAQLLAVVADDLEGHEKSTEIFFSRKTPYFAVLHRKAD